MDAFRMSKFNLKKQRLHVALACNLQFVLEKFSHFADHVSEQVEKRYVISN